MSILLCLMHLASSLLSSYLILCLSGTLCYVRFVNIVPTTFCWYTMSASCLGSRRCCYIRFVNIIVPFAFGWFTMCYPHVSAVDDAFVPIMKIFLCYCVLLIHCYPHVSAVDDADMLLIFILLTHCTGTWLDVLHMLGYSLGMKSY